MEVDILKCYNKIEILNETLWENRVIQPRISEWLSNFSDAEKPYALFLLSRMMYFNAYNIRYLLKALYRDLYRYPIIEYIRSNHQDTLNEDFIEKCFQEELKRTRFIGVGNPSESGVHLLYYFRQENRIPKTLFVNTDDVIYKYTNSEKGEKKELLDVTHFVFIDDLCGSGTQATSNDSNVNRCVKHLRESVPHAEISYLMIFGVKDGVNVVKKSGLYNHVYALIELDESYKCFGKDSRYFSENDISLKKETYQIALKYGQHLMKYMMDKEGWEKTDPVYDVYVRHRSLGWGDCQLLLSFHHNTPDNTLPIIWFDEDSSKWTPIFKRYNKIYDNDY